MMATLTKLTNQFKTQTSTVCNLFKFKLWICNLIQLNKIEL